LIDGWTEWDFGDMIPYVDDGNPEFNVKVLNKRMPSCNG
jgi:hypothetical protein